MPRLTPRLEAAKQQAATKQILDFLSLIPVSLDVTESEMDEIIAEAEAFPAAVYQHSEEPDYLPVKRHKLRSKGALALQLEVYRYYVNGLGTREIARMMKRAPSTIERALEAAKEVAGERYRVTSASKSVLFAEIEKCPKCHKSLAARGNFCKQHDDKLAETTETKTYQREMVVGQPDFYTCGTARVSTMDVSRMDAKWVTE